MAIIQSSRNCYRLVQPVIATPVLIGGFSAVSLPDRQPVYRQFDAFPFQARVPVSTVPRVHHIAWPQWQARGADDRYQR